MTGRDETGRINNEWHVGFPHSPAVCADHPQLSQSLYCNWGLLLSCIKELHPPSII